MKVCILMGSIKKDGNTATLLKPFVSQLESDGIEYEYIELYDYNFESCIGCFACQNVEDAPGCSINDDMDIVYKAIISSDCTVFASPIHTWFCTASMKTVLDRLFCLNKYYGETKTNYSLLDGKKYAVISTYGNEKETGPDLFEEAIKRLANHTKIDYIGSLGARDVNGNSDFKTNTAVGSAKEFAKTICNSFD